MTVKDSLKSSTPYPTPERVLGTVALARSLNLEVETTENILKSSAYRLSVADLYRWLYLVPNVTQEGISYSFTDADKRNFKSAANDIYEDEGEEGIKGVSYGYKGSRL